MSDGVALRRLPWPYTAALAICSDLDETPTLDVYLETARYLAGREPTTMGPGLGLEIGNSIYFDMPRDKFAYWNTDERGREAIRALIRSGHVDCLHSFGDLATTRAHAQRALGDLRRHDCRVEVWIDHSKAPTNFGADIMMGSGDVKGASAYHADLTRDFGVRYVWRGRVTSVIGQDRPSSLHGLFTPRRPLTSAVTVAREAAKQVLAGRGHPKYAIHAPNRVYRTVRLRDGTPAIEFLRSNPSWGGVSHGDTAAGLAGVLTESFLRRLLTREGISILYTHLGKVRSLKEPIPATTRAALERLAELAHDRRILVTTTVRLLRYLVARDHLRFRIEDRGPRQAVVIEGVDDPLSGLRPASPEELQGLTFEGDGRELVLEGADRVGTRLVFPWRPLGPPAL